MKSIKNVPNCISIIRIFISVSLLLVKPFSQLFFFLYLMCGISDVLDGYIARKIDAFSKFGPVLDSVSDLIFISIVLYIIIPIVDFPLWIIHWIVVIALIRVISLTFGFTKYRQLAFLHTYANKATGISLFCFPIVFSIFGEEITGIIVCCIASISATEELLINLTSKTLHRDRGSIFSK